MEVCLIVIVGRVRWLAFGPIPHVDWVWFVRADIPAFGERDGITDGVRERETRLVEGRGCLGTGRRVQPASAHVLGGVSAEAGRTGWKLIICPELFKI